MPGGGGGGLQLSCHGNDIAMRAGETFVGLPSLKRGGFGT